MVPQPRTFQVFREIIFQVIFVENEQRNMIKVRQEENTQIRKRRDICLQIAIDRAPFFPRV